MCQPSSYSISMKDRCLGSLKTKKLYFQAMFWWFDLKNIYHATPNKAVKNFFILKEWLIFCVHVNLRKVLGIMTSVVQPLSSSQKKDNGDRELCANLIVICQFFITIKHFEASLQRRCYSNVQLGFWICLFYSELTLETIIELSTQSAWDIFSITPTTDLIQFL